MKNTQQCHYANAATSMIETDGGMKVRQSAILCDDDTVHVLVIRRC